MIKLTQSLFHFLFTRYPDKLPLIQFGHLELFTDEIKKEYLEWVQTDDGKKYLQGGEYYKEDLK